MGVPKAKATIKVLNDFYLIEPDRVEIEHDKESGLTADVVEALSTKRLFIPEVHEAFARKQPMRGKVVSHGDKCKYAGNDIKLGDTIMFGRNCYAKYKVDGKEYFQLREYDVLAVLR